MRRKHPNTGLLCNPWLTSTAYHPLRKVQRPEGFAPLKTTTTTRGIIRSQGDRPRTDVGWAERRQFRRKAVIWAAKLETDHGVFDCITLDLSLGGARLRCSRSIALLEPATLVLDKFGKFPAEVVWTTPTEIGLQFSESPEQVANRFGDILPLGA
jgi:hypothetical protein